MKHTTTLRTLSAAGVMLLAGSALSANYAVTDLGTLSGPIVYASGVNDAGTVVGANVITPTAAMRGFSWAAGVQTDLGAPGLGNDQSHAFAINASGVIIGAGYSVHTISPQAFRFVGGVRQDLGAFTARAINTAGQIAGAVPVVDGTGMIFEHACAWNAGTLSDLGTLGGSSSTALGLDDSGRIVGGSFTTGDVAMHACLWQNGLRFDLGTLGGLTSQAYAVNGSGQIVGISDTPASGPAHAMLVTVDGAGGVLSRVDLGAPAGSNSAAYAINGAGTIVGVANYHAAIWTSGTLTDLNTLIPAGSGWELQVASSISPGGRIAGWGTHNGMYRAFILTPPCPGDITGDGVVNSFDLGTLLSNFGTSVAPGTQGDLNADGVVNTFDLGILLGSFGCGA